MKKYGWIIFCVVALAIVGIVYFYISSSKQNSNYSAERTNLNNTNNVNTTNSISNTSENNSTAPIEPTPSEIELASFSTKIKNKKDTNRQGNITITCSSLNNTIVTPGATFSFCDTVGQSTVERGYKEANVIIQGTEVKGLGGGNCQVSSTLYNAVLAASGLEVVERHPHSAPVPYIEEGKDAAISYGSHDFKFKNNTGSKVKIIAENTADNITIKLMKIL